MNTKIIISIISILLLMSNANAQQTNTQRLLLLQDQMENAKSSFEKRNILKEASLIPSFTSFMFISKSLNDESVNEGLTSFKRERWCSTAK